jgi:hypothetical protein
VTLWVAAVLGLIGLGLLVVGRGSVSALGLVLVGIALCVLGVLFVTTGGQMTFTINKVLLGVGVVFIAAAVVRVVIVASNRMQAPR